MSHWVINIFCGDPHAKQMGGSDARGSDALKTSSTVWCIRITVIWVCPKMIGAVKNPAQRPDAFWPRRRYRRGPLAIHPRRTFAFADLGLQLEKTPFLTLSKRKRPIGGRWPSTTTSADNSNPSRFIVTMAKCSFKRDGPSSNLRPTSFATPLKLSYADPRSASAWSRWYVLGAVWYVHLLCQLTMYVICVWVASIWL
jgi:hypothetical protein